MATQVKSLTQSIFGAGRRNSRLTLPQWAWGLLLRNRRVVRFAEDDALNADVLDQPCHNATCQIGPFPDELPLDVPGAVAPPVLFRHTQDLGPQGCVAQGAIRQPGRIGPLCEVTVVGGWGDRQNRADRLDPRRLPMIVNEPDHHFDRWSSTGIARYADVLRKIPSAWRFSRSDAFSRSAMSVGMPPAGRCRPRPA